MKIGVDIRTACARKAGKGWYTFYLVKELLKLDRKNSYILYTNQITDDLAAFHHAHIKVICKHPLTWHLAVARDFAREKGEAFFAPTSFIIPVFLPKRIKSVITVHDLVAFLHPHLHNKKSTILEHLFFRMALKKTSHVLVPSKNTARDLVRIFKYPAEKISVTPLAAGEKFFEAADDKMRAKVREKYGLPDKFILTVSGLEPRKNISTLIDALALLAKNSSASNSSSSALHSQSPTLCPLLSPTLVIVGGKGWQSDTLQKRIRENAEKIIHIENINAEDLPVIYKLAEIFVYPSLYEGFGLPPLEALASGCPVICSHAASLKEVTGNAALTFNPKNTQELSRKIKKLLGDENLRKELIERGKCRSLEFSWKNAAEKTMEILNMKSEIRISKS